MHLLNIYVSDYETDCKVLKISDISQYDSSGDITNVTIKIIIPGLDTEFYPPFSIKSDNYYSSNTFRLTTQGCGDGLSVLPDGLYDITYSICPNESMFTRIKHLRTCVTKSRIMAYLAPLLASNCNDVVRDGYGSDITNKRKEQLKELLLILDGAVQDAKTFKYNEAVNKINYVNTILNTY